MTYKKNEIASIDDAIVMMNEDCLGIHFYPTTTLHDVPIGTKCEITIYSKNLVSIGEGRTPFSALCNAIKEAGLE